MALVEGDFVTEELLDGMGKSYVLRWRIEKWMNGPWLGYDEVEYEGGGLWRGPRCVLKTSRFCSRSSRPAASSAPVPQRSTKGGQATGNPRRRTPATRT